jgi:hypothetical protein
VAAAASGATVASGALASAGFGVGVFWRLSAATFARPPAASFAVFAGDDLKKSRPGIDERPGIDDAEHADNVKPHTTNAITLFISYSPSRSTA